MKEKGVKRQASSKEYSLRDSYKCYRYFSYIGSYRRRTGSFSFPEASVSVDPWRTSVVFDSIVYKTPSEPFCFSEPLE